MHVTGICISCSSYGLASAPRIRFVKARSSGEREGAAQTGAGSQLELASTKREPQLAHNEGDEDEADEEQGARALAAVAGRNSYGFREPSSRDESAAAAAAEGGTWKASRSATGSSRPLALPDDGSGSDEDDEEILVPVKREPLEQAPILPPTASSNPLEPKVQIYML